MCGCCSERCVDGMSPRAQSAGSERRDAFALFTTFTRCAPFHGADPLRGGGGRGTHVEERGTSARAALLRSGCALAPEARGVRGGGERRRIKGDSRSIECRRSPLPPHAATVWGEIRVAGRTQVRAPDVRCMKNRLTDFPRQSLDIDSSRLESTSTQSTVDSSRLESTVPRGNSQRVNRRRVDESTMSRLDIMSRLESTRVDSTRVD